MHCGFQSNHFSMLRDMRVHNLSYMRYSLSMLAFSYMSPPDDSFHTANDPQEAGNGAKKQLRRDEGRAG
jgi:hypothetical protein